MSTSNPLPITSVSDPDAGTEGRTEPGGRPQLSALWILAEHDPTSADTVRQYLEALAQCTVPCELRIVDNGVGAAATAQVVAVLQEHEIPSAIVRLYRALDESAAIAVGLKTAEGSLIVLLPPYLQTDPGELSRMLERIEEGYDFVGSWRSPRVDSRLAQLNSALFNRLASFLTGTRFHDLNSGLRLMRREVVEQLPLYGDLHHFLPILAAEQGFRVTEMKTRHLAERVRKGDYRFGVYWRRLLDLLTIFFLVKFTRKPLRFFGLIGSMVMFVGVVITLVLCVQRLLGTALADRPALVIAVAMIVLGTQLFSLGLLGELIIFSHRKRLRDHRVEKVYESPRVH